MWVANGDWSSPACSRPKSVEAVEQPFPAAEHHRGNRDRQLFNVAARAPDGSGPPPRDEHVLAARRLARPGDGLVQTVHKGEAGVGGSVLRAVRQIKSGMPNGL